MKLNVRTVTSLIAVFSLLFTGQVFAQTTAGDAAAGQAKSAICAACHGADGNSVVPNWPKIAGQHPQYLERQMKLIRDGARPVPEMQAIVGSFTDQDFADLAAFYAAGTPSGGVADESLVAVGKRIYQAGNPDSNVPACMACHGPAGEGNPLAGYPALSGQHSVYTEKMLTQFRSGQTWGEDDALSKVMTGAASALTDEEIKAVASYIQGLYMAENN